LAEKISIFWSGFPSESKLTTLNEQGISGKTHQALVLLEGAFYGTSGTVSIWANFQIWGVQATWELPIWTNCQFCPHVDLQHICCRFVTPLCWQLDGTTKTKQTRTQHSIETRGKMQNVFKYNF
jgi:hypothetical protein